MATPLNLSQFRFWMATGLTIIALTTCNPSLSLADTDDDVFEKLDTNNDGVLSGTEAATVRRYDSDGDGEVTKKEYLAGIAGERKKPPAIDDDKLFADRDVNDDGILSGKEVRGFEKYDTDGDGEVSREEFDKGRAADRKLAGGMTKEEHDRLALEQFRKLDVNEDGRLSGKEMKGYEKLDANGDRRISEAEFIEGYEVEGPLVGEPLTAFLGMLNTSIPTDFLKAADPEFAKDVDQPILELALALISTSLGKMKPGASDALTSRQETVDGVVRTIYQGKLEFDGGEVAATLIVAGDRVLGFQLNTPALEGFGMKLHKALFGSEEYSKAVAHHHP